MPTRSAPYLDLHLDIASEGRLRTKEMITIFPFRTSHLYATTFQQKIWIIYLSVDTISHKYLYLDTQILDVCEGFQDSNPQCWSGCYRVSNRECPLVGELVSSNSLAIDSRPVSSISAICRTRTSSILYKY
jgi:hypothetical protein